MIDFINKLNTTSIRILATLFFTFLTTVRYLGSGVAAWQKGPHFDTWEPSWEWLLFLLAMAGVDGAVLVAKRLTDYKYKKIAGDAAQPTVNVDTANVDATGATIQTADPIEPEIEEPEPPAEGGLWRSGD